MSFDEALTVFADLLARIFDDEDHSVKEHRELIVGYSARARLMMVCFSVREGAVRIFSARTLTKLERRDYEDNVRS